MKRVGRTPALARVYATYGKLIDAGVDRAQSALHAPEPILAFERWGIDQAPALVTKAAERIDGRPAKSLEVGLWSLG